MNYGFHFDKLPAGRKFFVLRAIQNLAMIADGVFGLLALLFGRFGPMLWVTFTLSVFDRIEGEMLSRKAKV